MCARSFVLRSDLLICPPEGFLGPDLTVCARMGSITFCICADALLEKGFMIQCDQCEIWLHGDCDNLMEDGPIPQHYVCPRCRQLALPPPYPLMLPSPILPDTPPISEPCVPLKTEPLPKAVNTVEPPAALMLAAVPDASGGRRTKRPAPAAVKTE